MIKIRNHVILCKGGRMSAKKCLAKKIAEESVEYLFTSAFSNTQATRLVMESSNPRVDGCGWCKEAVRKHILEIAEKILTEFKNK